MTQGTLTATRLRAILVALILLAAALLASIALGSRELSPAQVWEGLTSPHVTDLTEVVRGLRLPRTLAAVTVGLCLGLAGTVMQALTRNPLADPGILGVNAGAGLAVVVFVALAGFSTVGSNMAAALVGAAIAVVAVHLLAGGTGRRSAPARLALAGVAVSAALSSLIQGVVLANQFVFNEFRFWVAGSLEGRSFGHVVPLLPPIGVALVVAVSILPALSVLALGDEAATALGVPVRRVRTLGLACVAVLAAAATSIAGPLSFVGLAVPLVARRLVGEDLRWAGALSLLLGPVWVLASDVLARVMLGLAEAPVGVILALAGAPVFIALVRARRVVA
ncbi:MAG: iron ABC transporter permease [Buchananella hordeovulneris]|nr:iron ABC transporter permease [Buchananella hordeovulneris]